MEGALLLGEVVGVFGVRGELRVHLHNREDSVLTRERAIVLRHDGVDRPARMRVRPGAGKRILATVPGVATPEAAQALVGSEIWIARSELPPPGPDEFYVEDLVGCVVHEDGVEVGTVVEILPGERDVWALDTADGEAWIVAEPGAILSVDLVARRVTVATGAVSRG